jgi:hypothetical protein
MQPRRKPALQWAGGNQKLYGKEDGQMKILLKGLLILTTLALITSCAGRQYDRFNTQRGAAIGAGFGALTGQIIGRNTKSTLIGAGIGTLVGALVGNAVDQERQIAREAAVTNRRIVYYDQEQDHAIEAIPGPEDQHTKCRKVTKREWDKGYLVSERVEEICEGEKLTSQY